MDVVRRQRARLCELLESLTDEQWEAETLCAGWSAADVAAHMLVREREPWASAGILVPPLAFLHEARMGKRKRAGRAAMQADLRKGPPTYMTLGIIGRIQVAEDYIHTEDVRRGGAATTAGGTASDPDDGTGDPEREEALWEAVARFAPVTLGGIEGAFTLALTDGSTVRAYDVTGRVATRAGDTDPAQTVTVTGPVGELLLYATGRSAADVAVVGPDDLVATARGGGRGL